VATSAATLIQRTRRLVKDWPDEDAITASVTSSATTLTVADSSIYTEGWLIEVEQEAMLVRDVPTGTTVTVKRGAIGSTAATHASSSAVLIKPAFTSVQILDALNEGLDACYPQLYKPVAQEYDGILNDTYEYNLPDMTGLSVPIPIVNRIEVKRSGETNFVKMRGWRIVRAATPLIKFDSSLLAGDTIRICGYGPFAHLGSVASELDAKFPVQAEYLLPLFAASTLLASGEAGRVRTDTGAVDQRENANRVGSSMQTANNLLQRFRLQLDGAAMPPPDKAMRLPWTA
jgi:hypothetical protein